MVEGSERSRDVYSFTLHMCIPSGKPDGSCRINCRLWIFSDPDVLLLGIFLEEISVEGKYGGPGNVYVASL